MPSAPNLSAGSNTATVSIIAITFIIFGLLYILSNVPQFRTYLQKNTNNEADNQENPINEDSNVRNEIENFDLHILE